MITLTGCVGEEPAPLTVPRAVAKPTAAEIKRQVDELAPLLSRKSSDLTTTQLPNGGVRQDTGGRFQAAMLARTAPDGRVVVDCVDNTASAEGFLASDLEDGTK